ncbi:MAG: helix-turn-helix transcriptional regulator [bacterium]
MVTRNYNRRHLWPAERVQRLLEQRGTSQESLARALGVSFATVNRWLNGHSRPTPSLWMRLETLERAAKRAQEKRAKEHS